MVLLAHHNTWKFSISTPLGSRKVEHVKSIDFVNKQVGDWSSAESHVNLEGAEFRSLKQSIEGFMTTILASNPAAMTQHLRTRG